MRTWLRDLRIRRSLSQKDVAAQLEVTQQHYALIEQGKRQKDLTLSWLVKLSNLFDVPVDYIIAEEEKTK